MLRSCHYCGRIHDSKYDCGKKPKPKKKVRNIDKFRWTSVWKKKREDTKQRDAYMCQICLRGLYNPCRLLEYDNLSVHHAESLAEAWEKRLDDDNLLTVCDRHHEMAESGEIPLEEIGGIIAEQEEKANGENIPPGGAKVKK